MAGRFFFGQFPFSARLLSPIFPLYELYTSLPFGSIVIFFAIYFGIIQNVQVNRFIRFNAMQAILIDILLILPMLVEQLVRPPLSILTAGYNTVWLYVFFCVVYGMGSCLAGEQPRLPLVADAADQQVR
ncbi:unnamed protein product [Ostreobium quekettii]|uniref:Protein TIC 20 n=1 Tax=Ostreobium quekettii TaxID=121088 RepID=A0A8S1J2Y7_9CHLO|nr:unnamed protein product [Ostreobium quekettii]